MLSGTIARVDQGRHTREVPVLLLLHGNGTSAHPLAGLRLGSGAVLVPGPRDEAELGVVAAIVTAAHRHASGPS